MSNIRQMMGSHLPYAIGCFKKKESYERERKTGEYIFYNSERRNKPAASRLF